MRLARSCGFTIFVYGGFRPEPPELVSTRGSPPQLDQFSTPANRRVFTSERPILRRLLEACAITRDPASAHALVVPALLGSAIVAGWSSKGVGQRSHQHSDLLHRLSPASINASLPHLTPSTARRHIFFCTVDSQFVFLGAGSSRVGAEQQAMWIHLGDDSYTGAVGSTGVAISNGLTVPYRTSHWLPFGFPPPPKPKAFLLFANVNGGKHPSRRLVAAALLNHSSARGLRSVVKISLSAEMLPVVSAAGVALRSTFCLCPTGDSKGFTARLYFSVIHNCIPVWIDCFRRSLGWQDITFPFPHAIDWRRVVLVSSVGEALDGKLLTRLAEMRQSGVADVWLRYIRRISHYLVFDRKEGGLDASDAALHEIEKRLGFL